MSLKTRVATKRAEEFLKSIGYSRPGDITIDEMIWGLGISLKSELMKNCNGRIVFGTKNNAVITIDSNLRYKPKENFVKAHELGHFLLHKDLKEDFIDTDKTLSEWYSKGFHEIEANHFASEILMPAQLFIERVQNKKLTIELIKEVAKYFGTSITATFIRYKNLGIYPIALIYCSNGIIKWSSITEDFVLTYIQNGQKVSRNTATGAFHYRGIRLISPEFVNAIDWFPEDREILKYKKWRLREQCFKVGNQSTLTCLWES